MPPLLTVNVNDIALLPPFCDENTTVRTEYHTLFPFAPGSQSLFPAYTGVADQDGLAVDGNVAQVLTGLPSVDSELGKFYRHHVKVT